MIHITIEIEAPPSLVRDVLFDFPSIPTWNTNGLVQHISPLSETKTPMTLLPGDKLSYKSSGLSCKPTVLVISDTEFKYGGWVWGLLCGKHCWRFEESKAPGNEGGTIFVQEVEYIGLLAWFMQPVWAGGEAVRKLFEQFNRELKQRVESLKAEESLRD